jgi:hypothetical protein
VGRPRPPRQRFDWARLKEQYVERYAAIAALPTRLPRYTLATKVAANASDVWRRAARLWA